MSYFEIVIYLGCCDNRVDVCVSSMCSSQHGVLSPCTLSASTQLVVHAQLWYQSLCGKPWCMEWGACWAVWVCCCHDNLPLINCSAHEGVVFFGNKCCLSLCMAGLQSGSFVVITKNIIISKVFFYQSGQSPKIIRAKGVVLERTDSQTVGEFPRGRRKGRYSTLNCHCVREHFPFSDLSKLHPDSACCWVHLVFRPVGSIRDKLCPSQTQLNPIFNTCCLWWAQPIRATQIALRI